MSEVRGLRKLLRTLEALPPELGSKGGGPIRRGLLAAAKEWRESVVRGAPVGTEPTPDLPRLKDSIVIRRDKSPQDEGFAEQYSVGYASRAYWGGFVEEGTAKQSAQPFLRPVADSEQNAAIRNFVDAFRKHLDRAVKKAKQ